MLLSLCHCSILSRGGAVTNTGAVHIGALVSSIGHFCDEASKLSFCISLRAMNCAGHPTRSVGNRVAAGEDSNPEGGGSSLCEAS
jgi:hypothetical protein